LGTVLIHLRCGRYTWRLFYNNGTCAQAPFTGGKNQSESECEEYMSVVCSPAAPLEKNALFYGFSGLTGCSPDPPMPPSPPAPPAPVTHNLGSALLGTGRKRGAAEMQAAAGAQLAATSSSDPIKDKIQHLASFLLIRGPYAWLGWAWLGCGNFPYRPPELDVDYGTPLGTCSPVANEPGVFAREYTKASVRVDCRKWEASISPKK
jgi:hypothetical protein